MFLFIWSLNTLILAPDAPKEPLRDRKNFSEAQRCWVWLRGINELLQLSDTTAQPRQVNLSYDITAKFQEAGSAD